MKVHLRKRKQEKGKSISLYLEYYLGATRDEDGKVKPVRKYESLGLYLIDKPKTPLDRQQNKQNLELAEKIRVKKQSEYDNGTHGFIAPFNKKANFIEYFKQQTEDRFESEGNYGNWGSTLKHLKAFAGEVVPFKDVNLTFCEGFLKFLENEVEKSNGQRLSSASVSSYFLKFRASLKQAVKERLIPYNHAADVPLPKVENAKREYLTLEELRAAAKAECRYDVLKRAFLFSCLTGLRWSDIEKMKWREVVKEDEGWRIIFRQKKTKENEYLDINEEARQLMGKQTGIDDKVFIGLKYSDYMNVALQQWMLRAGITKHITFHCGRHSYAVLQLTQGTSIYTVSKLLGHSNVKTTEIYSDIVDEVKKKANRDMPSILNS